MFWLVFLHVFSSLLDLVTVRYSTEREKIFRYFCCNSNFAFYKVRLPQPKRLSWLGKVLLIALVVKFKTLSTTFRQQLAPVLLFKPETVPK
jgi:hypothetical protein